MFKRILFIIMIISFFASIVEAGNNDARIMARNSRDYGVDGAYGIVDVSDGDTAEVDDDGNLHVIIADTSDWTTARVMSDVTPSAGADCSVLTGDGLIQSLVLYSNTADNYALIYDGTSTSGTLKYDIVGGANVPTVVNFNPAISVSTGIFAYVSAEGDNLAITYKET